MGLETLEAHILCGGLGTRLRSEVRDRPKPLALVDGRPFLQILIEYLARTGVERFILCAGHRADALEELLPTLQGVGPVRVSTEEQPLGTGGALRHALRLGESDPVLALNGDSICALDLPAMLHRHRENGAGATLALVRVQGAGDFGSVRLAPDGHVERFAEKSETAASLINAGIYLIGRALLLERMPPGAFSLERDLFPALARDGELHGWVHEGDLLDIGTPERYRNATQRLRELGLA